MSVDARLHAAAQGTFGSMFERNLQAAVKLVGSKFTAGRVSPSAT